MVIGSKLILAVFLYALNKLIRAKLKVLCTRVPLAASLSQQQLVIMKVYLSLFVPLIIKAALLETYIFALLN
ncbi:hypothetical protein BCAMP_10095 [Brochothrix campestris FSL F6-1037]|uniref:Uncharacterized protein n=1 Tax=Brochothrix campestris FSL F6-1037 TaxID=1265861 RepID=W7CKC4_9LIST|nr:hypothetical protein BCAMP_10095 [Brochothrix campestris FSL F6-1037]